LTSLSINANILWNKGGVIVVTKKLANIAIQTISDRLRMLPNFNERIAVLFSGGRDSTIIATAFCNAFPNGELHLLFIDNGVCSNIDKPYQQYENIRKLFPLSKIIFETKQIYKLMNRVSIREIESDFTKYHFSTLLVCVSCKLAMFYAITQYAKEKGINYVVDGFSTRQNHFPEQTQVFIEARQQIDSTLTYCSPLYDFLSDRDSIIATLHEFGILDKQEASCMFANSFSTAKDAEIKLYIKKSDEIIHGYLQEGNKI
jgi:PP-loop superfamily ATP-utilizing enzyme